MKYSSRFFLYAPLTLFLLLAVGAGVRWWFVADALSKKLDSFNGRPCMPGVTLYFSSKKVSGFPFNLDVVFQDFRVEIATDHGPSVWKAHDFAIHALSYGREQMIFEAAGEQLLTWTDLDREHHVLPFQVGEWHASSIADEHGLKRFDMDLVGFGSPAFTAARIQLHARLAPTGAGIDVAGEADMVRPAQTLASPFGDTITLARFDASASHAGAFDAIRSAQASWQDALESWRKAGGVLHVDQLELNWNRIGGIAKGELGLDDAHAVEGMLDFKIGGMPAFLDQAARRHLTGAPDHGIAAALIDRAAKAGSSEAGLLGAIVGFHGAIVTVGDEPATREESLY